MNILYISRSFPGSLLSIVRFIHTDKANTSVFMAERWPRDTDIPGVKKVRIPAIVPCTEGHAAVESRLIHHVRQAETACGVYARLHKGGLKPDVMYATPDTGYALCARDYFPSARLVFRAEYFHRREAPLSPLQRVHNATMLYALEEGDAALTTSAWQKNLFPAGVREKIHIVRSGVDTRLFQPAPAERREESIVIAVHGAHLAEGMASLGQILPLLLTARPRCRVRLLFFTRIRSEDEKQTHTDSIAALLPPLPPPQRQRVEIIVSPPQRAYIHLLQGARVYIYIAGPSMLSAGILEAMSCGALVVASGTGPVREIVHHGENGFLGDFQVGPAQDHNVAHTFVKTVVDALHSSAAHVSVQEAARATILDHYDIQKNLVRHAALLRGV